MRTEARSAVSKVSAVAVLVILAVAGLAAVFVLRGLGPSSNSIGSGSTSRSTSTVAISTSTSSATTSITPSTSSGTSITTASTSLSLTLGVYNTTIPAKYASEISGVQAILNSFNSSLGLAPSTPNHLLFATELLPANCNRGPDLLQPTALAGVSSNLKALKAMGLEAVTVCIGYPLLDPSFPNSTQYLAFYQQVSATVHADGMKLLVECGDLFANTPYSPMTFDWTKLTFQEYVKGHIAQYQLIIDKVKPDYLELGVEADTEALLTGFTQLGTVSGWTSYIEQALAAINKTTATKLVAGAGTWDGVQYMQGFANDPKLDYISTHVYPIYGNNLNVLLQMGQLAKQDGKRLVIDEAWAQKVLSNPNKPGAGVGGPSTTPEDVFCYSDVADIQFLRLMVKFSQSYPVEFFSPFSELYFFSCLNWTAALDAQGYFVLYNMVTPLASQNIQAENVTPTGWAYASLATSG